MTDLPVTPNPADATQQNANSDPAWLPDRLERAQRTRDAERLRELGADSFESVKAILAAQKQREQDELAARGEHQKVIDTLKPQAEQAERYKATLQKYLDVEIASIPEDKRVLIPKVDIESQLEWISTAKQTGIFGGARQPLPDLNAGVQGDRAKSGGALTAEELEQARKMRISPEQYAKYKNPTKP